MQLFAIVLSAWIPVALASTPLETLLNDATSYATAEVQGNGTAIELTYSSDDPFIVLVVFDAKNYIQSEFAPGTDLTKTINLTKSTLWSPGKRDYKLHFLTTGSEPQFHDIEFIKPTFLSNLSSFLFHLSSSPPYSPTSYHHIEPYRVFGISLTVILGVLMIILVLLTRSSHVGILVVLLFSARFSIDALVYSYQHTHEWLTQKTYATAGALPQIGTDLQDLNATDVYLCNTGTSYAPRALAYYMYPVRLVDDSPSHIVVHKAANWSFEDATLRCGNQSFTADLLETYADGSSLYQTQ